MTVWQWTFVALTAGVLGGVLLVCRALVDGQCRLPVEDESLRRKTDALGKVVGR